MPIPALTSLLLAALRKRKKPRFRRTSRLKHSRQLRQSRTLQNRMLLISPISSSAARPRSRRKSRRRRLISHSLLSPRPMPRQTSLWQRNQKSSRHLSRRSRRSPINRQSLLSPPRSKRQRRRNRRRQNLPLIRQINHSPRELALRPRRRLPARQA